MSHPSPIRQTAAQSTHADEVFVTLDVHAAAGDLPALYERVAVTKGRVELTRDGSDDSCVIISKSELESLERAIELLSDGDGVRAMHETLRATFARLGAAEVVLGDGE